MSEALDPRPAVEALVAAARAEAGAAESLVVTEFLVIASATGWNGEGDDVTAVVLIPDGPSHRMLGLIEEARIRFQADVLETYGGPS